MEHMNLNNLKGMFVALELGLTLVRQIPGVVEFEVGVNLHYNRNIDLRMMDNSYWNMYQNIDH